MDHQAEHAAPSRTMIEAIVMGLAAAILIGTGVALLVGGLLAMGGSVMLVGIGAGMWAVGHAMRASRERGVSRKG